MLFINLYFLLKIKKRLKIKKNDDKFVNFNFFYLFLNNIYLKFQNYHINILFY